MSEQVQTKPVQKERKPKYQKEQKDGEKPAEKKPRNDPQFLAMQADQAKIQEQIVKAYDELNKNSAELKALFPENKNKFIPVNEEERKIKKELVEQIKKIRDQIKETDAVIGDKTEQIKLKFKSVEQLEDEIYRVEYELEHNNHTVAEEKDLKKQIDQLIKLKISLPALLAEKEKKQAAYDLRNKLYDELKPLKEKESQMLKKRNEELQVNQELHLEKEKLDEQIKLKKDKSTEISEKIKQLKLQKDEIYNKFLEESQKRREEQQKKYEENQKKYEASKAARAVVDELKDAGAHVYEKERNSGDYEVSIPKFDYDPQASSKNGIIGWLKQEIEKPQPKPVEVAELSKQDKKKQRQLKKFVNLDLTIDSWLDDLKIKAADVETVEQKKAMLLKIQSGVNEEIEKEKEQKMAKINNLIDELKKIAKVTVVDFKPRVEFKE